MRNCGWVTLKVLNRPCSFGSALPCSATTVAAPCSALSPAPRRSCTCNLKPPVEPRPSTGGAPNADYSRFAVSGEMSDATGKSRPAHSASGSPPRSSNGLSMHEHAAHIADVGAQQDRVARHFDGVVDAGVLPEFPRPARGRSGRNGLGVAPSGNWTLTTK